MTMKNVLRAFNNSQSCLKYSKYPMLYSGLDEYKTCHVLISRFNQSLDLEVQCNFLKVKSLN